MDIIKAQYEEDKSKQFVFSDSSDDSESESGQFSPSLNKSQCTFGNNQSQENSNRSVQIDMDMSEVKSGTEKSSNKQPGMTERAIKKFVKLKITKKKPPLKNSYLRKAMEHHMFHAPRFGQMIKKIGYESSSDDEGSSSS